jgi:hypothetical protein
VARLAVEAWWCDRLLWINPAHAPSRYAGRVSSGFGDSPARRVPSPPDAAPFWPEVSMRPDSFKAKAYLMEGCPFSFKFLLFLTDAGICDRLELIRCDPNAPDFEKIRSRLQTGLDKPATFPTVEIEPGRYLSDSDALITYYASRYDVEVSRLPTLSFYLETIFPQLLRLHESTVT